MVWCEVDFVWKWRVGDENGVSVHCEHTWSYRRTDVGSWKFKDYEPPKYSMKQRAVTHYLVLARRDIVPKSVPKCFPVDLQRIISLVWS